MSLTFRVQTSYGKQECLAKPTRTPPDYTYSPAMQPRAHRASPYTIITPSAAASPAATRPRPPPLEISPGAGAPLRSPTCSR